MAYDWKDAKRETYKSIMPLSHVVMHHEPVERTALPSEPCWKCGARGWCNHRKPE